jgi:hypothetical protein
MSTILHRKDPYAACRSVARHGPTEHSRGPGGAAGSLHIRPPTRVPVGLLRPCHTARLKSRHSASGIALAAQDCECKAPMYPVCATPRFMR